MYCYGKMRKDWSEGSALVVNPANHPVLVSSSIAECPLAETCIIFMLSTERVRSHGPLSEQHPNSH